ncbi:PREDICTED: uncharacterized protein LOC104815162 [Tarenaya hassleriana]|uniref:uncharacterized protein LOC104815162 n=1 Tax=Tarenaya hassleriana TaxID=28532 RepID=UPI00053C9DB1|nr:PREDICTED: uncharacterized protein LOC104815162 [Tarenaya hassleriana]
MKELELLAQGTLTRGTGEGLVVKGKPEKSGGGKKKAKDQVECWYCGKKGHYKKECRSRRVKEETEGKGVVASVQEYDSEVLLVCSDYSSGGGSEVRSPRLGGVTSGRKLRGRGERGNAMTPGRVGEGSSARGVSSRGGARTCTCSEPSVELVRVVALGAFPLGVEHVLARVPSLR